MLTHPHLMRQKGLLVPSCWASGITRRADEKAGEEKNGTGKAWQSWARAKARQVKSGMTDTLGGVG